MSYTKQTFNEGDRLKAEHLNHIEDGLSNLDANLTKTSNEIKYINFVKKFLYKNCLCKNLPAGVNYYTECINGTTMENRLKVGQIIELKNNTNSYKTCKVYYKDNKSKYKEFGVSAEGTGFLEVQENWYCINFSSDFEGKLYLQNNSPLILYSDKTEEYDTSPMYGEEALQAIVNGRQILVRVPNADGGKHTAIYSPVYMYQVPNKENDYLYLFYLKDEKNVLDLGILSGGNITGHVEIPIYGELKMKLHGQYNYDPVNEYTSLNIVTNNSAATMDGKLVEEVDNILKLGEPFVTTVSVKDYGSVNSVKTYMNGNLISTSKSINIPEVTGEVEVQIDITRWY